MFHFLKRSQEIKPNLIQLRRWLHQNPELGCQLPLTSLFIKEKLLEMGCQVEEIQDGGLVCTIGNADGKCILLRADMDALPIEEHSYLSFSSKKSGIAHCCGHDLHTTFLLGAAQLLKEQEETLRGAVKLVFQSGEEILEGARNMIGRGVLENPHVDVAIGIHVQPTLPIGHLNYPKGAFLSSTDTFEIEINGKGGHGGIPHLGIDPINIAVHLVSALQSLQVKEVPAASSVVINVCKIAAGSASNIIPDTATLQGTLRTYDDTICKKIKDRICQIADMTAGMFGGTAAVDFTASCPCTVNNPKLTDDLGQYLIEFGINFTNDSDYQMQVSDDFAFYSECIPSTMFIIGCQPEIENSGYNHSPIVQYNEDVLPIGAALLAHLSFCWLENNYDKLEF